MAAFHKVVYNDFVQFWVVSPLKDRQPTTWSEPLAGQLGVVPSKCRTPSPDILPLTNGRPLVFMVYAPLQFMVTHVIADQTVTDISSVEK